MLTKLEFKSRLLPRLAGIDEPQRSQIAEEVAERYRAPGPQPSRWCVSHGVQLTEPSQPGVWVVERADGSCDVYTCDAGHELRAKVVEVALNAIEADLFGTASGTAG